MKVWSIEPDGTYVFDQDATDRLLRNPHALGAILEDDA
ncbi:hypothetical protein SEA_WILLIAMBOONE_13 [Gordonia phage WilliamBoone]|nr:hypothetical protein SEA_WILLIAMBOONE_13 [Gordonia phage WilliamBoone]